MLEQVLVWVVVMTAVTAWNYLRRNNRSRVMVWRKAAMACGLRQDVLVAAANALSRVGSAAAVLPLKEAAGRSSRDPEILRATRQAIARIQLRLPGASPGQLALAEIEAGRLSLAEAEAGQLSLATAPFGQLSLPSDEPGQASRVGDRKT